MGLVINREIEDGCRIGLWEITEDYETLFSMTYLNDEDLRRLHSFRSHNRKIEWLSVRALLQQMLRPDARIIYHQMTNKPFLDDGSYNISISHSHKQTTVILGKNKLVGVDLEFMSHRIERVAHKFINESDVITTDPHTRRKHLYIHWCAKETLFKICDKVDINFQEDLTIQPFEVDNKGYITGVVHNNSRHEEYKMCYLVDNNYVWVYSIK